MNVDEVNERVKEVNQQREKYIKSSNYVEDMTNITLQNLNFKSNDIPISYGANAQTEFMSIYCQVIDLYPEVFGEDSKNLKQSIINSIYAYADMDLFKYQLGKLINNNSTSFLIIPTSIRGYYEESEKNYSYHAISTIISKEDNTYKVTTVDKSAYAVFHLGVEGAQLDDKNLLLDYTYYLKENEDNRLLIAESLSLKNDELNGKETANTKKANTNLMKIEKASFKKSCGEIKAKGQTYSNCFIKGLMSGLKYATLPIEKDEKDIYAKIGSKDISTQKINSSFSYIMIYHLERLGFSDAVSNYLAAGIRDYNNFKNLKSKDLEINPAGYHENVEVFIKQQKDLINSILDGIYEKYSLYSQENPENIEDFAIHYGLVEKESIVPNQSKIDITERDIYFRTEAREDIETLISDKASFKTILPKVNLTAGENHYRTEVNENIETVTKAKASFKTIISKVQEQTKLNEIIRNQHKPTMTCEKESTIQAR